MRMINNVKLHDAICLELGDIFFTSLTILGFESNVSICSTIKENLPS